MTKAVKNNKIVAKNKKRKALWRDYEKVIHEMFSEMYPEAEIVHNTSLTGRYSKTSRQIDILITDYAAGEKFTIVVDGKYYGKHIDVKEVESFLAMLMDTGADKGLLITTKGYSKAAIRRAHNDPARVELDVLNFDELQKFQGFLAIPYSGAHGVFLPSPFGWVIDATRRKNMLASLYQRGLTYEKAQAQSEWMYMNIFDKSDRIKNLDAFLEFQEARFRTYEPNAEITYHSTIKRQGQSTRLRKIVASRYPVPEFTGFIDFDEFLFFCVLFSPEELTEKNLKKLEYILAKVQPIKVDVKSDLEFRLKRTEAQLKQTIDAEEKAGILIKQGDYLKELKKYGLSERKYNESTKLFKTSYGALKGKIDLYLLLKKRVGEFQDTIDSFFELGPKNPVVCRDLLNLFDRYKRRKDVIALLKKKIKYYKDMPEAQGNISYHLAQYLGWYGGTEEARAHFEAAKAYFKDSLKPDHAVFGAIEEHLRSLH
jgi:hypothetical protein